MFKLMGKLIYAILGAHTILIWTFVNYCSKGATLTSSSDVYYNFNVSLAFFYILNSLIKLFMAHHRPSKHMPRSL